MSAPLRITDSTTEIAQKRRKQPLSDSGIARSVIYESSAIGALMLDPQLCVPQIPPLTSGDLCSGYTRTTFTAIENIISEGRTPDPNTVVAELGESVPPGLIGEWISAAMPEQFAQYKRAILEAANDRRFKGHYEALGTISDATERLAKLREMQEVLEQSAKGNDWRKSLFHSSEDIKNCPPLTFRISGFLQESGITLIGGLAKHGKTLILLSICKSLIEQTPLFGYQEFSVPDPAKRVLYITPETSIAPIVHRLKLFGLDKYVGNGPDSRFFVYTMSKNRPIDLNDPQLLKAAEGADIFLDTCVRLMQGDENSVEDTRKFVASLLNLLQVARSVTGAHHSPKKFQSDQQMTLENVLRGSGDIGAGITTAWGVKQIESERNQIYVKNVACRDFQACEPFVLQGRPYIDDAGNLAMVNPPGTAGEMKQYSNGSGRPAMADKDTKRSEVLQLHEEGKSIREIAKQLELSKSTVDSWIKKSSNGKAMTEVM